MLYKFHFIAYDMLATIGGLLEKYPNFFWGETLVDFNEVRLHEATLNSHTHARIVTFTMPLNAPLTMIWAEVGRGDM